MFARVATHQAEKCEQARNVLRSLVAFEAACEHLWRLRLQWSLGIGELINRCWNADFCPEESCPWFWSLGRHRPTPFAYTRSERKNSINQTKTRLWWSYYSKTLSKRSWSLSEITTQILAYKEGVPGPNRNFCRVVNWSWPCHHPGLSNETT